MSDKDTSEKDTSEHRLISEIIITERFRKDLGDFDDLCRSIQEVGLLHAIVINEKGELICGHRRVEACKRLGWTEIPVRVVNLENLRRGEIEENISRKNFTVSEIGTIMRFLEPAEKEKADQRQRSGKRPLDNLSQGRVLDAIARSLGISRATLEKAVKIVEAAEKDPERYLRILEDVDLGRTSIDKAYQMVKGKGPKEQTKATGLREAGAQGDAMADKISERGKPIQEDYLDAKVFRLFEAGKRPIDAVIELNISSEAAKECYLKWIEMKQLDLSAPSVPAILKQFTNRLEQLRTELVQLGRDHDNSRTEIVQIEEHGLARAGLLDCQQCEGGKLVSEVAEPDGFLLVCKACGYRFGPYFPEDLQPFFYNILSGDAYERTQDNSGLYDIEWDDEPSSA